MMLVTAILGIIGLWRLGISVTQPQIKPLDSGTIVRSECVSIWLHPALDDLAARLSESRELQSQEAMVRNAERPSLKNAWYIITLRSVQANGKFAVISIIRHPYGDLPQFTSDFPEVLATAAGTPPRTGGVDYSVALVGVIPDRLLSLDPRDALEELRSLERVPGPGKALPRKDRAGRLPPL
jgi:hypothetical protein